MKFTQIFRWTNTRIAKDELEIDRRLWRNLARLALCLTNKRGYYPRLESNISRPYWRRIQRSGETRSHILQKSVRCPGRYYLKGKNLSGIV